MLIEQVKPGVVSKFEYLSLDVGHKNLNNLFLKPEFIQPSEAPVNSGNATIRKSPLHSNEKLMKSRKELLKVGRGSIDHRVDANTNDRIIR